MDVQFKQGSRGNIPVIDGLTWSSSDQTVLQITPSPQVISWQALKPGTSTITAKGGTDLTITLVVQVHP